jgi:hypothetical protein
MSGPSAEPFATRACRRDNNFVREEIKGHARKKEGATARLDVAVIVS